MASNLPSDAPPAARAGASSQAVPQRKKIAIFSMTPLYPDVTLGGSQAQLKKVSLYLGEQGHTLTILATRDENSTQPFKWHENVEIHPILRFRQPFPQPYLTPIYHIGNAMRYVHAAIAAADVHYSHDGDLIFPYVYQDKPTVISHRNIIYPESLQSAFLFQGDEWILPSEHTRASYAAMIAQFAPAVSERMHTIHNGFDWDVFTYTAPDAIFELIPPEVAAHPTLLFPHRPEVFKGIYEVIQVVTKLVYDCGFSDLRILVPRGLDAETSQRSLSFYNKLCQAISDAGLNEVFVFHDWITEPLLPEYYSLADLTLCIGSCVETFGNTPFESLGCGTPAIVARVSTYRDLLPDAHIERVDYGDIDATVAIAQSILRQRRRTPAATLQYLRANFSLEEMVTRYADVILNAQKRPPLSYRVPQLTEDMRYQLAPWCYLSQTRGIYHDFRNDYQWDETLISLARSAPAGFFGREIGAARLRAWLDAGYIVPVMQPDGPD